MSVVVYNVKSPDIQVVEILAGGAVGVAARFGLTPESEPDADHAVIGGFECSADMSLFPEVTLAHSPSPKAPSPGF